ncbi:phytoene desaturase family protein [Methanolobus halotolerans]|uniref:NAD(P)/FAD-dependent oxidoreductase n=1 Tax=Methanolobus halotolerans TaxID=2052935 RepID=A0A4E0Q1S3_9EURY|nr:NAD(P)/FAD-dependent oxidoreductase [Methanolobus halotolerans]TGC11045.1 NAD(P)/FAD-dependent oxidoreductase [Methanolobus halotolerans]
MEKYDVIVIGAGISGLLSALALSKHGNRVLILEKNSVVGGNCNSYMVDGFQVDTGAHAITHLGVGPLRRLMDNYFDYIPIFEDYGHYYVRTEDSFMKVPSNIKEFVTFDVLPKMDRIMVTQAITKALTLCTFGIDLSKQSVYDFMPGSLCKDTYDFIDAISYFLSGKDMKHTSAQRILAGSSFVRDSVPQEQMESIMKNHEKPQTEPVLKSLLTSNLHTSLQSRMDKVSRPVTSLGRLATNRVSYSQGYPRKGLKALLNALLFSLPKSVEIKTECEVFSILTKDGRAIGVEADEMYYAENIVYTGFVTDLPKMIDNLPASYVDELKGIVHTKSLTTWIGLDKLMEEFSYIGSEIWFKNHPYWAMPISNYDASLAPKGKQLVGFSFIIDDKSNEASNIKRAYETIYHAIPSIEDHIEMKHEQITIPEKAAVTIDGYFADVRTPVKNLYVAGTDTDKRSMGITRASYSVIELLKKMNEDRNLHR